MKILRLRQPKLSVHVDDIQRVESLSGDEKRRGTWIYLRDGSRSYCEETEKKVREMIEEAKSQEEILLDALAINLLSKAANESSDCRLHFTRGADGLTVTVGAVQVSQLEGRNRSKYEHAEQQICTYALVTVESKGIYRLNERGHMLAEFLVANNYPADLAFSGFVKLPARFPETQRQIGVQIIQTNTNKGDVNNAISEQGNVEQTVSSRTSP